MGNSDLFYLVHSLTQGKPILSGWLSLSSGTHYVRRTIVGVNVVSIVKVDNERRGILYHLSLTGRVVRIHTFDTLEKAKKAADDLLILEGYLLTDAETYTDRDVL